MPPSKPCCTKKGAFTPLTRPTTPPFSHANASFSTKCCQSSPVAAWMKSKSESVLPGDSASRHMALSRKPWKQGCSVLLRPLFLLHTARMPAGSAVCHRTSSRCALSSHGSLRPPSLSAMMEHTFMLIMPDCHGRLFCFAVEKSVPPRGDQIPGLGF